MYLNFSLKNMAYLVISVIGLGWLLYIGSSLVLPILFAVFFTLLISPIEHFYHRILKFKWLSILMSFLTIMLPLFLITALLSYQLMEIIEGLPSIGKNLQIGFDKAVMELKSLLPPSLASENSFLKESMKNLLEGPIGALTQGVISSSGILVSVALTFIYTFFLLYYKKSFKNFIIYQYESLYRPEVRLVITKIKTTVQKYIGGLAIVITILAVANSIGLYAIGIDYPIFWGVLAALLAIIPYFGTAIGGGLPFIYSLATADYSWQPVAIIVYYLFIQQIEGNLITPKIVGNQVNINPLVAIISLIFFGMFWGIGGVILALPLTSIIKIVLDQFRSTRPIGILISSEINEQAHIFEKIAD
jgi:predicted PurR-regulated permease PerM